MPQAKLYKDTNLQIVFGVTLMAVMGVASIAPAFPRIVEELQISRTDVGMLIVAFTLPGVVLNPFLGVLADRFGRKLILVPCLLLFGLAGGACAFSDNFNILIALRVLQGLGAAALGSINVTLIGDLFSGERRTEAMGLNASVLNAGLTSYPLIGGALATLAWNYPFLLALTGIPIGILALKFLRNPEPPKSDNFKEYLTDTLSSLKKTRAISTFMAGVITFILLYGAVFTYFSLYLGNSFHASPFTIGLITSSMSLSSALVSSQLGKLAKITSVVNLIKLGFVACAIALALIPFMPRLELFLIPTIIYGIGSAIIIPSLSTYAAGLAPTAHRAAFMSVNGTMFRLGQTLGPLTIGLAYVYWDFRGAFLFAAGLALTTAVIGFVGGKIIH